MKAVLCKNFGPPESLSIEDVPSPEPGADEILIEVVSACVNFPDTLIIENKYQVQPDLPFVPGSEAAGIVLEVGRNVRNFKPGDRVMGLAGWGAFAERMVVDKSRLFLMPENFDFPEAAVFSMAYGTAYHALQGVIRLKENDRLLVLGAAGGVGLAAVHLGKTLGAEVIAAASSDRKLEATRRYGADHTINYAQKSLRNTVKQLTDGKGVDVIYDPVGGDYFDQAIRLPAFGGTYLVIGFSSGRIPTVPANIVLLKGIRMVGVHWGRSFKLEPETNRRDFENLLRIVRENDLKPLIHGTFPLNRVGSALRALLRREVTGKIVLTVK